MLHPERRASPLRVDKLGETKATLGVNAPFVPCVGVALPMVWRPRKAMEIHMEPKAILRAAGLAGLVVLMSPAIALAQGGAATSKPTNTPGMPTTGSSAATTPGATNETGIQAHTRMTENEVASAMKAEGYSDIENLKMANGYYTADAKYNGKQEHNLQINAATGKVMNQQ